MHSRKGRRLCAGCDRVGESDRRRRYGRCFRRATPAGSPQQNGAHMDLRPRPYLSVRPLHHTCRPCVLSRRGDAFLIQVHPGTPRAALLAFIVDELTIPEQNAMRRAIACGPVGTPLPEWMTEGECWSVLPGLRLDAERDIYAPSPDWPTALPADWPSSLTG